MGVLDWYDKHLDHLQAKTKAKLCILAGDFNCHHQEWLGSRSPTDVEGKTALSLCNSHGLTQIVNGPTHILGNCLDLIMTDAPNLFMLIEIDHGIGISDHFLIKATVEASPLTEPTPPRLVWLYKKADWDGLRNELAAAPWDDLLTKDDPEKACTNVTDTIHDAMTPLSPKRQLVHLLIIQSGGMRDVKRP